MQKSLEHQLVDTFVRRFGAPPALLVCSPGRVNLIGDHTDYNDGWVFPAALDREMSTLIAARPRADRLLCTVSLRLDAQDETSLDDVQPKLGPDWTRYVRGVAALLQQNGSALVGADILIDGGLPQGAGLSSSASLEMGIAAGLVALAGRTIPLENQAERLALARLGQQVEHTFVGVECGIMDQVAVACGVSGHALLIDCRTLAIEPAPIPDHVRLLVLDSATPRALTESAYNQRRRECESAVQKLRAVWPDVLKLRDVTLDMLVAEQGRLTPDEFRRARHVITENQRVLQGVVALRQGNVVAFGCMMRDSHASLRYDYEVSSHELDTLVSLACKTPGVVGARMTGAGFGGCVVALVEAAHAETAVQSIPAQYKDITGLAGKGYVCAPGDGTQVLTMNISNHE